MAAILGSTTSGGGVVTPTAPLKMRVGGVQVAVEGDPADYSGTQVPITIKLSTKLRIGGKWAVLVGSETEENDPVAVGTPRLYVNG